MNYFYTNVFYGKLIIVLKRRKQYFAIKYLLNPFVLRLFLHIVVLIVIMKKKLKSNKLTKKKKKKLLS